MDNWIIVYTTVYPQEIYPVKNFLEANGIITFLKDELTAQVNNFYSTAIGGVKLLVHNSELERCRELLVEGGYLRAEDFHEQPVDLEIIRTTDRKHCPYCSSDNISRKKEPASFAVLLCYMVGIVLPVFKPTYQCWDCDKVWKFGK